MRRLTNKRRRIKSKLYTTRRIIRRGVQILQHKEKKNESHDQHTQDRHKNVTDTNESIIDTQDKEREMIQNIDTRLIINNGNTRMADEFISIIREYNSRTGSSTNETCAYLIKNIECRYKITEGRCTYLRLSHISYYIACMCAR
jgi:hypothetical protein